MNKKTTAKNAIEFLKYLSEEDEIKGVSVYVREKNGEECQVAYLDDYYAVVHFTGFYNKISEEDLKDLKQMEFIGFRVRADIDIDSDFAGDSFDEISMSIANWNCTMHLTLTRIKIAWERFQRTNREKNEN